MANPILQEQGVVAAVTSGNLAVTLPAYVANDIVVLTTVGYVPNTTVGANTQSLASPWTKYSPNVTTITGGLIDTEHAFWWARATSSSSLGTTVTITRPANWDTGTDTVWAGRAYVIRGCETVGNPYDELVASAISTAANPQIPAITVSGSERNVLAFYVASDNLAAPTAATGYTVKTAATTNTGTDAGFQTYEDITNASLSAVTPTGGATSAQNFQVYFVASFKPTPVTVSCTATGSGAGTETAVGARVVVTFSRTATGVGSSDQFASGLIPVTYNRTASGAGSSTESATVTHVKVRTATGSGVGTQTATGRNIITRKTASGSGAGTQSATGVSSVILITQTHIPTADSQDGNWKNSVGNNTNMFSYIDDVWNTFDGGFVRGATDTTDISTTGQLHLNLTGTQENAIRYRSGRIRFRWRAANLVDDTATLQFAFISNSTLAFGASSTTYMSANITSTTFVDSGWINFTYTDTSLTAATNNAISLRLRQVITPNGSPDGTWIEIDAVEVEVTYVKVAQRTAWTNGGLGGKVAGYSDVGIGGAGISFNGNPSTTTSLSLGMTFIGDGKKLENVSFAAERANIADTGDVYAKLYAHTGTYGSGTGTGTPLAISKPVSFQSIPLSSGAMPSTTWFFDDNNKYVLQNGTPYIIVVEFGPNTVAYGFRLRQTATNSTSPNYYAGNAVTRSANGTWSAQSFSDYVFSVEAVSATGEVIKIRTATGSGTGAGSTTSFVTISRTASDSDLGSGFASDLVTNVRTATGSGTGTQSATGLSIVDRVATGSGIGTETATSLLTLVRTATGSGAGDGSGDDQLVHIETATGSGSGTSSATGLVTVLRTASGSGDGTASVTGLRTVFRTADGSGVGSSDTVDEIVFLRTAGGSGVGSGAVTQIVTFIRTADGSGVGSESATVLNITSRTAAGNGLGTEFASPAVSLDKTADGSGLGTQTAEIQKTAFRAASGSGLGTQTAVRVRTRIRTGRVRAKADSIDYWDDSGLAGANFYFQSLNTSSGISKWGQSFQASKTVTLDSLEFLVTKIGTPPGFVRAEVYQASSYTTFNFTPIATSENVDPTTLNGPFPNSSSAKFHDETWKPTKFAFTGANRIRLVAGQYYVVVVDYIGYATSDVNNAVRVNWQNVPEAVQPQHPGVRYRYLPGTSSWTTNSGQDVFFWVNQATASTVRSRTATGSGAGTEAATGVVTKLRDADGSGLGSSVSVYAVTRIRNADGSGIGSGLVFATITPTRTANGSGLGSDYVTGKLVLAGTKWSYWGSNMMIP